MHEVKKFYQQKNVLITGHTGFKGSWLSIWLNLLGANIFGISLKPKKKSMFEKCNVKRIYKNKNYYLDINNYNKLKKKILKINPEIIFHLAAQPLVKSSYEDPLTTFKTNIIGTANLLFLSRKLKKLKSIIIVTTDKCYENTKNTGYRETDRIGGSDPYSASKACAEIISKSLKDSFYTKNNIQISTVRAGNVLGGGDYSNKRLIPDIFEAYHKNKRLFVRNKNQVRPWQHVLDPLFGYLKLGTKKANFSGAWNFGPKSKNIRVIDFIKILQKNLKKKIKIKIKKEKFKETNILNLNIAKSKKYLKWNPILSINKTAKYTIDWYDYSLKKNSDHLFDFTVKQIKNYESLVK